MTQLTHCFAITDAAESFHGDDNYGSLCKTATVKGRAPAPPALPGRPLPPAARLRPRCWRTVLSPVCLSRVCPVTRRCVVPDSSVLQILLPLLFICSLPPVLNERHDCCQPSDPLRRICASFKLYGEFRPLSMELHRIK